MSRIDDLYARFESRFRGSRESILQRLSAYGPLLSIIEEGQQHPVAIDCGCGRGEWLELLVGRGWAARGVDLNERMLADANERGLYAVHGDAIAYLQGLADKSVRLVSAFHLVEHLPSDRLLGLLSEMSRVVVDGGIVLLETPNPENLAVGTSHFYLDPTHDKPLPPQLLQFYVEECGVRQARILRINGEPDPASFETMEAALRPMLHRALDYAVVGIQSENTELVAAIESFIDAAQQGSPIALDGVRRLDALLASRRDADEAVAVQRVDDMRATVEATRDSLHEGIRAVYDNVLPLAQHMDAASRRREELTANLAAGIGALHGNVDGLPQRMTEMEATFVKNIGALHGNLDGLAQRMTEMEAMFVKNNRRMEGSLREAVATSRRSADAREHRILSALENLRRSNNALFAERESRQLAEVRATFEKTLEQATRTAVENTKLLYENTSSWKATSPLRKMVTAVRSFRTSKAAAPPRPAGAHLATVRHVLLSNRIVWSVGKRAVRMVPGLRMRLLRSLDRQNILVNPLAGDVADERLPLGLYQDDEHAHLDDALRIELMPPAARRIYLRMIDAQATGHPGASS